MRWFLISVLALMVMPGLTAVTRAAGLFSTPAAASARNTVPANADAPLLRARQALEDAQSRVLEDQYAGAVASLRTAARSLDQYHELSRGPNGLTAFNMAQDIGKWTDRMAHEHQDTLSMIEWWLYRVDHWYDRVIS